MYVGGLIGVTALALVSITFTALLLVSGWNALREELWPGFRSNPPGPRSAALTLLGIALPVLLTAALSAYFAIRLFDLLSAAM